MTTQFPQDPHLTGIAIAYRNPDLHLIADSVLPRTPVGSTLFQYTDYNSPEKLFTLPNTKVGPTGRVNRLELGGERKEASTSDEALDIPLSFYDINASGKNVNARQLATEAATSLILLRREVRTSGLVFDEASYPTANKEQLAGAEQLNDGAYAGNPLTLINDGLDSALVRPNVLVFGHKPWSVFRTLPDVVKAVHGNSGDSGMASRQQIAELFEVQEVLVGTGWLNTAAPGEAPVLTRVWGNHIAAIFRDRSANTTGGLTFGFTAEYGTRVAGPIPDQEVGMRGGERVRVGESLREIVVASSAAYFWEDVVA